MRKRSAYRPKMVITDPLSLLRPASKERQDAVMLKFYTALHELTNGNHPGTDEWRTLSDAINTVETMATPTDDEYLSTFLPCLKAGEVMPLVNTAIAGMVAAANRFKAGKGMRLDSAGLEALRDVVDIYGQCLSQLTERGMAVAQAETQRRVNEIYSSKESAEVVSV